MKTGVKISLWIVGVGAGLYLAYLIFMGIGLFGGIYTYTITYPAACWTDDGKQIIYLENRQIDKSAIMPMIVRGGRIIQSKTYLMIMDANSKNKKVVGEVPEQKTNQYRNFYIENEKIIKQILDYMRIKLNNFILPTDFFNKVKLEAKEYRNNLWTSFGKQFAKNDKDKENIYAQIDNIIVKDDTNRIFFTVEWSVTWPTGNRESHFDIWGVNPDGKKLKKEIKMAQLIDVNDHSILIIRKVKIRKDSVPNSNEKEVYPHTVLDYYAIYDTNAKILKQLSKQEAILKSSEMAAKHIKDTDENFIQGSYLPSINPTQQKKLSYEEEKRFKLINKRSKSYLFIPFWWKV